MTQADHAKRIRKELIAAKMTAYGLRKSESRYLPKIIHPDEHIGGVVYGRNEMGSAMLIATDRRVIYLDRKPMFTINEEVTYEVVSGFKMSNQGLINVVTLHTRIKDFRLRFVNRLCAVHFKHYLESRHLEGDGIRDELTPAKAKLATTNISDDALLFLKTMDVGVLSTASKSGVVHGSTVYYFVDEYKRLFVLTKAETKKAHNIIANKHVAFTVFNADEGKTLQLHGKAEIETDENVKQYIFAHIMKPRKYASKTQRPPVAWLNAGMFVVIRITPTSSDYTDFTKKPESTD